MNGSDPMALRRIALLIAVLIAGGGLVHGQGSSALGQVQGVVVDSSGAAVAGAQVSVAGRETGLARTAVSGDGGQFVFSALPIGQYVLRVEAAGFGRVETAAFLVSVGQVVVQRMELRPAAIAEKLEVKEEVEALQAAATTSNVALGYDRVEEAPSQSRNYMSFVFSAPGVATSNGANTGRSAAGTRNVANDSGFVFHGMRARNNSLSIDGVDNRDETTGGNRVAIGLEMVQEFRVSGMQVSAELGGAAGGLLNVVTRSGTNQWHGDATYFFQNEKLNARNAEAATRERPRARRSQPGVSIYGPIVHDRSFFAAAIEGSWDWAEEWSETPEGQVGALSGALNGPLFARAGTRRLTAGLFPTSEQDTEGFFKWNHTLNAKHALTARYAFSRGSVRDDVQGVDNFTDWSARGSSLIRDHSVVGSVVSVLSAVRVNDLRMQWARRRASITPNAAGPMYDIPGVLAMGGAYRLDQARTEDHFEVVDSLSVTAGTHLISMGGSLHTIDLDARLANRFQGVYVFPTLGAFLAGRPDVFLQAFGQAGTRMRTTPAGGWVQDRWQVRRGLTVEAGVRVDSQGMPAGLPGSGVHAAPRLGIAWRLSEKSPWVVRAAGGLFYDRYPLAYLNDAVQKDGRNGWEQFAAGAEALRLFREAGGDGLTSPDASVAPSVYRASASFPATYSRKLSAGVERALDQNTTMTVEVSAVEGYHLPRVRNFTGTLPAQYLLEQTARSRYMGGTMTINRRMSRDWSYLVSYSAGRTRDDASDYDEQPMNPLALRQDWALSRQHQMHRVTASALFELPAEEMVSGLWRKLLERVNVAPSFTYGSERPLNALATTDVARTGAYPISARPFGLGRNAFWGPAVKSLDARVFKVLPVKEGRAYWVVGVESFNLLNHTNAVRVSPYYAAGAERMGSFGRPMEIQNARQIQLLVALEY